MMRLSQIMTEAAPGFTPWIAFVRFDDKLQALSSLAQVKETI